MCIKFKIIVYRAKIQKKCAEYKKLAVSFNNIRYAQECTKKKTACFSLSFHSLAVSFNKIRGAQECTKKKTAYFSLSFHSLAVSL